MHIGNDPTAVFFVLSILCAVSILLQIDLVRHATCKECPHCQEKLRKEKEQSAEQAHSDYHFYDTGKCQGFDKCPGWRKRK